MATPEDMNANAEYIRMADEVVDVPGGTNNNNYANINLICEIAQRLRVDAVMPMWGHASENPLLPTSLLKLPHRVTFIGPPAAPMQALGDKIGSTIIAQSAGVPTIAWNGDGLTVDYKSEGIPQSVYDQANVRTAEDALACCERIGYPVMIKASEGGGGKGIRKVLRTEDVLSSYRQVQGEIPGSPIFVMKMASRARHLEVQLLADKYGEAIALSGRDCSVQRRHQKIIEEGPPTAAPVNIFKKMERAAVSLAKTVGYCNAGTVEYLYMEDTQEFAFLELNPRLQVEHPVTENILGLNLPACQLQVAMGIPLHRIADIRKLYGRHLAGRDTIDFEFSERAVAPRHCIAVRVTAENPDAGFQPTSGKIKELQFRSSIDVWGYFSVDNSGLIHEFADSQFGHIFASGPTRECARKAMLVALKEVQIRGDIRTTMEYIIKLMQSDDFVGNKINTDWLDGRIARHKEIAKEDAAKYCPSPEIIATCGASLQGFKHFERSGIDFIDMLNVGQIPPKDMLSPTVVIDLIYDNVKYHTSILQSGANSVTVECNGSQQHVSIKALADGGYLLNVGGKSHLVYSVPESGGSLRMILDGHTCIFTPEYDPTRLTSSVAGKIARLLVDDGSHVNAGDAYVEIEVMKMYMPLRAAESGVVSFQISEGAALSPGDLIATVKLDSPDKVVKAAPFTAQLLPAPGAVKEASFVPPHLVLRQSFAQLMKVLEGFPLSAADIEGAYNAYTSTYNNDLLPVYEMDEAMAVLRGRMEADLYSQILELNASYKDTIVSGGSSEYPSARILSLLHEALMALPADKRGAFNTQTQSVWAIAELYLYEADARLLSTYLRFIEQYLNVEKMFDDMSFTDVVSQMRKNNPGNLSMVLSLCRSHVNLKSKNILLIRILEDMKGFPVLATVQTPKVPSGLPLRNEINNRNLKIRLSDIAKLRQGGYSRVSVVANLVLIKQYSIKPDVRRQRLHEAITAALTTGEPVGEGERTVHTKKFVDSNIVIRDLLVDCLRMDKEYRIATLEIYLLKTYQATHMLTNLLAGHGLMGDNSDSTPWIKFDFKTRQVEALGQDPDNKINIERKLSFSDLASLASKQGSFGDLTSLKAPPDSPGMRKRSPSQDSLGLRHPVVLGSRCGIIAAVETMGDIATVFPAIAAKIPALLEVDVGPVNAIHVIIMNCDISNDDDISSALSDYLKKQKADLASRAVRRVTFFVSQRADSVHKVKIQSFVPASVGIFTFRIRSDYSEDSLFRHIEAPHAYHLDLPRLSNFRVSLDGVQTSSGNVFLYKAVPNSGKGPMRYFSRLVSFSPDNNSESESLFVEALDHLGLVIGQQTEGAASFSAANHIFISIVAPEAVIQPDLHVHELRRICTKYWYKMVRLAVSTVELKISCKLTADADPIFVRLVASNPTGFVLKIDQYYEAHIDGKVVFKSIGDSHGPWDGMDIHTPHPTTQKFEQQRSEAMLSSDTLYVYDWPELFEHAAEKAWERFSKERGNKVKVPLGKDIFSCEELVLCSHDTGKPLTAGWTSKDAESRGVLLPVKREPGQNDVGMVAWLFHIATPECPDGRDIVIISNDITHQAGSFGTKEDVMFFKASEYARKRGLPRIFLAANSGARIGMAQSLKSLFQVSWTDPKDPSKGFKYIYLSKPSYDKLMLKYNNDESLLPVICQKIDVPGEEERYVISDIIGEEPDLGVENLMGSGLIAGETARAYDEIFTLTLVVGRTVGIGAYLVRLGQRTVQKTRNSPIILTGYQALNKLMGREIYTTNDQLGGPMIMFPNGVSHLLAETHMESVTRALGWMSFVPAKKGGALPIRDICGVDTVDRFVDFSPTKTTYDPRLLLCGVSSESSWQSGFFDRNSFIEALGGWAKTVIVGRGRLGGVPMGVIVTENRTAEATKPADPADITSREKMVQQAGGVWFPDSAYKTAQALKDFNREGLPCIIFANWRGFSGGQRDMFDEVLKFGSMIVDALVAYQQPLFVYIPPFAELRGGAWVVVDSTINADVMEFYAAEDARGGVLEAAGAASIKFRDKDIIATAHRIDHVLVGLDTKIAALASEDTAARKELEGEVKRREKALFGVYQQVAVHFADLHDTPGRMKSKGVIKKQVQWADSRTFFYWRLKRRLVEFDITNKVQSISTGSMKPGTRKDMITELQVWFGASGGRKEVWEDDRRLVSWFEENSKMVDSYIQLKQSASVALQINEKIKSCSSMNSDALKSAFASLDPAVRKTLLDALQ